MHTYYKIHGYFEFQFFTYHLSSVVHSATLINYMLINVNIYGDVELVVIAALIVICSS